MKLKAVAEHLQEKRRHASFRELQELDEEKLKVARVIIGERIRRRLSQTALARRLGVTQQFHSIVKHTRIHQGIDRQQSD